MKKVHVVALALGVLAVVRLSGATAQTATETKEVEQGQKVAEQEIKAKLPWKVDEVTTMTDVEASGLVLTYWYLVATYKYTLKDGFIEIVRKSAVTTLCKNDASSKAMKFGAVYRFIYFDARGKELGTFDAKVTDCE